MEKFAEYLNSIEKPEHRAKVEEVLSWVAEKFPQLETRIGWNQPMFTDHGTYIIGLSVSTQHISISPETAVLELFRDDIEKAGYTYSKMIFRIRWDEAIDYSLLDNMITFNIVDKADYKTFWRK